MRTTHVLGLVVVLLLSASAARAASVPLGPDYAIPAVLSVPIGPDLAGVPEDVFLLGWEEPFGAVSAVAFRHDGTVTGSAAIADPGHTTLDPVALSAGGFPGEFMFFWEADLPAVIMGRRLDLQARPLGDAFVLSSIPSSTNLRPAASPWVEGYLLAVWESDDSYGNDRGTYSIQMRGLSAAGQPSWPELQVNDHIVGDQRDPALAISPSGRIVVVWESEASPGSDDEAMSIQARLFDTALGGPPQFQVNTTEAGDQEEPHVAIQADGSFLVVWESESSPGGDADGAVIGRVFDPQGIPLGQDFQINRTTVEIQDEPEVVAVGATYEVVWTDDGTTIRRRCYDREGNALTEELQVNTTGADGHWAPSIARGAIGHIVAAWRTFHNPADTEWRGRSFAEVLFADGFESGDLSAWQESLP